MQKVQQHIYEHFFVRNEKIEPHFVMLLNPKWCADNKRKVQRLVREYEDRMNVVPVLDMKSKEQQVAAENVCMECGEDAVVQHNAYAEIVCTACGFINGSTEAEMDVGECGSIVRAQVYDRNSTFSKVLQQVMQQKNNAEVTGEDVLVIMRGFQLFQKQFWSAKQNATEANLLYNRKSMLGYKFLIKKIAQKYGVAVHVGASKRMKTTTDLEIMWTEVHTLSSI